MYSYEERLRAVKLYIKLGKRVQATIRELGYPTKNALKGWHREYQRLQDLPIRSAPRVVSRMLWKFPGSVLRACEGSVFQAARSRGIGSRG